MAFEGWCSQVDRLAMRGRNGVAAGTISPVGHFADAGDIFQYILHIAYTD